MRAWSYGFFLTDRKATGATQTAIDTVADALQTLINSAVFSNGAHGTDAFLRAEGNANADATRSLQIDSVSRYESLSVSAQAQLATGGPAADQSSGDAKTATENTLPAIGLAAQSALSISTPAKNLGLTSLLGPIGDRMALGVDFMHLNLNSQLKNIKLSFTTIGLGGSYLLSEGSDREATFRFEGIKLASGVQYARQTATYKTPLKFSKSSGGYTIAYSSSVDVSVDSKIFTVPIEATTGVTLFRFVTLYGGLGVGFNFGSTSLTGGVSGPVSVTNDSSGASVGSATAGVDVSAAEPVAPVFLDFRFFTGIQLNFWSAKVFFQSTSNSQSISGVMGGLRAAL